MQAMTLYYPAFLNLKNKKCIVAGGGRVAERKILSLLKAGADVTAISPELTQKLEKKKTRGKIRHIPRAYKKGDLKSAFLVVAATNSNAMNKRISKDAPHLINVVDMPSLCNFIVPSVIRRGPLTIAISTSGASPATAKAIRKELEKLYGPEFARHLNYLGKMRSKAMVEIKDKKQRKRFLKKLAAQKIKQIRKITGR